MSTHYSLDTILFTLHEFNDLIVTTHSYELYFIYEKIWDAEGFISLPKATEHMSGCTEIETVLRKEGMVIVQPILWWLPADRSGMPLNLWFICMIMEWTSVWFPSCTAASVLAKLWWWMMNGNDRDEILTHHVLDAFYACITSVLDNVFTSYYKLSVFQILMIRFSEARLLFQIYLLGNLRKN